MMIPFSDFGQYGLMPDHPSQKLPVGAFKRGRNVKFNGSYMERVKEPEVISDYTLADELVWMEQFWDGADSRLAAASATNLYIWNTGTVQWDLAKSGLDPESKWHSFAWGNTVVFNNGIDIPQVFNVLTDMFVDLPHWGVLTSGTVTVKANVVIPFKNFLVALNVEEGTSIEPNTVWWSDSAAGPNLWDAADAPVWDYEVATNLSGKTLIGLDGGPLTWGAPLGEGLVIYTTGSAHSMLLESSTRVFGFRSLFRYGCAGLNLAVAFDNYHLVLDSRNIYVHDGNRVKQVAEHRVKNTFFNELVVEAQIGTLIAASDPFDSVRMAANHAEREIHIYYNSKTGSYPIPDPTGVTVAVTRPVKTDLVYNYEDDNWSFIDASVELDAVFDEGEVGEYTQRTLSPVNCMLFGLGASSAVLWSTWNTAGTTWAQAMSSTWAQLLDSGGTTKMYWLCPDQLYEADRLARDDLTIKSIYVEKTHIDLRLIAPDLGLERLNHMRQMYPLIEGDGVLEISVGWSPNISAGAANTTWQTTADMEMQMGQTDESKIDFRTTGRYLGLRFFFNRCTQWAMTGCDVDMVPSRYGR